LVWESLGSVCNELEKWVTKWGCVVNKQRWLGELESLCDLVANRDRGVDNNCMDDRDRLIEFANRLVAKQIVSRHEVVNLIYKVDKQIFGVN